MTKKLQDILDGLPFEEALPAAWSGFDLARFSKTKRLWDYQQRALQNALKALWKYYQPGEGLDTPALRKAAFYAWYCDHGIELPPLPLGKKREFDALLGAYYPIEDEKIAYQHFINRAGFWMATGSGKTLVLVKLIELLYELMKNKEIPRRDILVLTHREDLLQQLRDHVHDYNTASGPLHIHLRELKEFPQVKRSFPSLLGHQETTVFFYRSDNLSDEQKERIVDFHNYDNNGEWFILLDEAHKGKKDEAESKRPHIYNILSRNGFLFNFSATFIERSDILTTAAEFNLASFIQAGYGKHIALLQTQNYAFKTGEDFSDEEKQKIVLQSLLMLAYCHKNRAALQAACGEALPYHRPLLLALVNSVNTEDADLKLFFAQLARIAAGDLSPETFRRAKADLRADLNNRPAYLYEGEEFAFDPALFDRLTLSDVLELIFNSRQHSAIEVLTRPSNNKELAFKLKSSAAPFALIRIGETADWLRDTLSGYQVVQGFEDESFFARINRDDSEINLLMGSRSFYEGWDSNRPNVITFINIGGSDAQKFILQSVGRGVRLEPLKGKRRRLLPLRDSGEVENALYQQAKPFLPGLEALFIFGTNRNALESVFKQLKQEKDRDEGIELALEVNPEASQADSLFLIPVYRRAGAPVIDQQAPKKFDLAAEDMAALSDYVDYLGDDRLLLAHHEMTPSQIGSLRKALQTPTTYFNTGGRRFGRIDILLPRLARYLDLYPAELEAFKPLEDEINHYQHIRVFLKDIKELLAKIKAVQEYQNPQAQKLVLKERFQQGELDLDGYTAAIEGLAQSVSETTFTPDNGGAALHIKHLAAHYYLPLLISEQDTIDYIQHIIKVKSEIAFLNKLENCLARPDSILHQLDWWMFSRTDESLDRVIIPYYDPTQNKMREFHPDFIFWLRRGEDYTILFVDPKGMVNVDYQFKIDGYKALFASPETDQAREFSHKGLRVRVCLAMYTGDANQAPQGYRTFWEDDPEEMFKRILEN